FLVSLTISLHKASVCHDIPSFPTRRSSDLPSWLQRNRRDSGVAQLALGRRSSARACKASARCGSAATPSPCRSKAARRQSPQGRDRKSTRLNSSHVKISYAVFCLKKKNSQV